MRGRIITHDVSSELFRVGRGEVEDVNAIHVLKCWPKYFEELFSGKKTFDIRRNDRDYKVGEFLDIKEWCPTTEKFSGRSVFFKISHTTAEPKWVQKGYIGLSLKPSSPKPNSTEIFP